MATGFCFSAARAVLLLTLAQRWEVREAADTWDYAKQDEQWSRLCYGGWQSPINIEPKNAVSSKDEIRFNYKPWRMEDVASAGVESDGVPRIRFKDRRPLGKVQVGSGYSNFDEYALTSVEVHAPSEHTLRDASWALELQLWHEPIGLSRAEALADHSEELSKAVHSSKTRFSALDDAEENLRGQVMDGVSPWSTYGGGKTGRDPKETMDWVDSTKNDIQTVSKLLRKDTQDLLADSSKLSKKVEDLVALQKRRMASHRLAVSIFVLRASPVFLGSQNGTATSLVRWLSDALLRRLPQSKADQEVEIKFAMGGGNLLYSYEGSVPRPPCTPNVRWFILGEPQASEMEQLSLLLEVTKLGGMISGDARDVQEFGEDRRLYQVEMKWEAFEAPALQAESVPQSRMKLMMVTHYCKVFLMCSIFLILTPIIFKFHSYCSAESEDSDGVGVQLQLPLKPDDEDKDNKEGETLKEWSPRKKFEERQREQSAVEGTTFSPTDTEDEKADSNAVDEAE